MTYHEAAKRALATFIFGALSTPFSSTVLDVSALKVAAAAGIAAVLNFAFRAAESYLAQFETEV
jgi:hypothetical protein